MFSINNWYKHLFERLGWTVIMAAKGYNNKVSEYRRSIDRLLATIDHAASEYMNHDRIHDLRVMRMNVEALKEFVGASLK